MILGCLKFIYGFAIDLARPPLKTLKKG